MPLKIQFQIKYLTLVLFLILGIALGFILRGGINSGNGLVSFFNYSIQTVSAEEIYPIFFCPCCGQPLDKKNICCGQAQERITYIDSLVSAGKSEKDVVVSYAKKYGLNSFVDKNKQEEFRADLIKEAPQDRPIIALNPESIDLGDVSQKKGNVFVYFDLKNEGKSDLFIKSIDTSCGCTFAGIVFEEKESPLFTMAGHGSENPEWEGIIIPAEKTAKIKVKYDPTVHPDLRGPVIREIYISSDDPIDFQKKVKIELNQVD